MEVEYRPKESFGGKCDGCDDALCDMADAEFEDVKMQKLRRGAT